MDQQVIELLQANSGSLSVITGACKLTSKIRTYFDVHVADAKQLVEQLNQWGWGHFLSTVPGFGRTYARRLHDALEAAGYSLPPRP